MSRRQCTGPCDQGRRSCPCPDACEVDDGHVSGAIVWPIISILALVAVTYIIAACKDSA